MYATVNTPATILAHRHAGLGRSCDSTTIAIGMSVIGLHERQDACWNVRD